MKIKLSAYNIYTQIPDSQGELGIVNGISGETYTTRHEFFKNKNNHQNMFDYQTLSPLLTQTETDLLLSKGILTDLSEEKERSQLIKMSAHMHTRQTKISPGYTILMSYECNFRCNYCYQMPLNAKVRKETMTKEMIDRILISIKTIEAGKLKSNNFVRNFTILGGEALTEDNVHNVAYLINEANALGPSSFTAVSNCYDLDHYFDLLGPGKIAGIQVTFDGPEEVHDQSRVAKNRQPTFKKIADNVEEALNRNVQIRARVNLTYRNIHSLPELMTYFKNRGWLDKPNFSPYVADVHGKDIPGLPQENLLNLHSMHEILDQMKQESMEKIVNGSNELRDTLLTHIHNHENISHLFKSAYCGAHANSIVFDAYGKIHTCWETDTTDDYVVGKLNADGQIEFYDHAMKHWHSRHVGEIDECSRCAYAFLCGGGCAVQAKKTNKDFFSQYCNGFQESLLPPVAR